MTSAMYLPKRIVGSSTECTKIPALVMHTPSTGLFHQVMGRLFLKRKLQTLGLTGQFVMGRRREKVMVWGGCIYPMFFHVFFQKKNGAPGRENGAQNRELMRLVDSPIFDWFLKIKMNESKYSHWGWHGGCTLNLKLSRIWVWCRRYFWKFPWTKNIHWGLRHKNIALLWSPCIL